MGVWIGMGNWVMRIGMGWGLDEVWGRNWMRFGLVGNWILDIGWELDWLGIGLDIGFGWIWILDKVNKH